MYFTAALDVYKRQTQCCAVAVALFGGYFLAAYAINQMGIKMFGMTNDIPLAQQFAGYALVVTFLLHIVTGLLPDFSIIGWLLQFYIVYVVWEGARDVYKRQFFTHNSPFAK